MHVGAVVGAPLAGLIIQKTTTGFLWVTAAMGVLLCVAALMVMALGVWVAHTDSAEKVFLRRRENWKVVPAPVGGGAAGPADGVVIKVDPASVMD
jgi:hypothetical protein